MRKNRELGPCAGSVHVPRTRRGAPPRSAGMASVWVDDRQREPDGGSSLRGRPSKPSLALSSAGSSMEWQRWSSEVSDPGNQPLSSARGCRGQPCGDSVRAQRARRDTEPRSASRASAGLDDRQRESDAGSSSAEQSARRASRMSPSNFFDARCWSCRNRGVALKA